MLIHGMRTLSELYPRFVMIKIDLRNAYNMLRRLISIVRLRRASPELARLAPFVHALLAHASDLLVDGDCLFADDPDRSDSEEGLPQGMPLSSLLFCIGIHAELRALDRELAPYGGAARAIMDDVYAYGPPEVVFAAVARFEARVWEACGLELVSSKSKCWSSQHDLRGCPWRLQAGVPMGSVLDEYQFEHYGLLVGGVPIGDDRFVEETLRQKSGEVVSYIQTTAGRFRYQLQPRHEFWAVSLHSMSHRFDYWLQHCFPMHTRPFAAAIDTAMVEALTSLGVPHMFDDTLIQRRLRLRCSDRGGGIRSLEHVAAAAWTGSFIHAAERFRRPPGLGTGSDVGFFDMLARYFRRSDFADPGTGQAVLQRFTTFLSSGSPTALEFRTEWAGMQAEVQHSGVSGPLDEVAWQAGAGRGAQARMQHILTRQREQVLRDDLHADMVALDVGDPRRLAWMAPCRIATSLLTMCPTQRRHMVGPDFSEHFCTYLGAPTPVWREVSGGFIPDSGGPVVCDAYGLAVSRACLLQFTFDQCHEDIQRAIEDLMLSVRLRVTHHTEMFFAPVIPMRLLVGRAESSRLGIIPDLACFLAMTPVGTTDGQYRRARAALSPGAGRMLIFDIKGLHGGGSLYRSRAGRDEQSGAVRERARRLPDQYQRHARQLDQRLHGAHSTTVVDHLDTFTPVRSLVVGHYGEASADVHELVDICADRAASQQWRLMGARSQTEARSYFVARFRRELGLAFAQAQVGHRMRRRPLVGMSRDEVRALIDRSAQQHAQRGDAMRRHHEQGLLDPAEFWAGHAFRGPAMVAVAAVPGDA